MRKWSYLFLGLLLPNLLFSATFNCRVGDGIAGVRKAIMHSATGDTVWVDAGYYSKAELLIDHPLFFCARGHVVFDGMHQLEVILVRSDNVTIEGFEIINTGYSDLHETSAIRVENARGVAVLRNVIRNAFFGIYLANSSHCRIQGNKIFGNAKTEASSGNGIHMWKCRNLYIGQNEVHKHRDGIYVEFTSGSTIVKNVSKFNLRYGLHFMFSNDDAYYYNYFSENGSGVAVMYSHHVKMQFNEFNSNWGPAAYGLLLKEITHSEVGYNVFRENTMGIYLEGSNDCLVHSNHLHANGWAMRVQGDCFDDSISGNNFSGNSFDLSTNATRNMNWISNNYWDRYKGYDLNRDAIGDTPHYPVSLYAHLMEDYPDMILLLHSFFIDLLNQAESIFPVLSPEAFGDKEPFMYPHSI